MSAQILFIASGPIGDAVLCTGALEYALEQHPGARAFIACGPVAAPLFRATPNLAKLHIIRRQPWSAHWFALWRDMRGQHFDLAVDMRGTATTLALSAKRRIIFRKTPLIRHKVEEFAALMGADRPLAPRIRLDEAAREAARAALQGASPLLAMAPGGDYAGKLWPAQRFTELAARLTAPNAPLAGATVVLRCGPADAHIAADIAASLGRIGVRALDLTEKMDLLAFAAVLAEATLFVGNDSGPMHMAAALGAPTLGLFGPTDDRLYAPWGPRARALRAKSYEDLMARAQAHGRMSALMDDISVDAAEEAAQALLLAGGLA
ncbi:MAG: glycosyltransferase family 9 protein [Hyphomonadaceae bacterium]